MTFSPLAFAKANSLLVFLFFSSLVAAHTIKGVVTDTDGNPIKNTYILHTASGNHTHSNASGFFELDHIEEGDVLQISHVGFTSLNVEIEDVEVPLAITLTEAPLDLDAVLISNQVETLNVLADVDLAINPVTSSQEILQKVPGLFIGQHAGGGKAEQIFLRGFDVDHGTDVAINVDGMPVNMVSHAHGQGYADLHFIIPETINNIEYGKGSYDTSVGNFATAGQVSFQTKKYLDQNKFTLEIGNFNLQRYLGMVSLVDNAHTNAYVATEYLTFDGPFESPQNFDRINLFGKLYHKTENGDRVGLSISHFDSEWDASGQIPQRAVDRGLISRFGAIDDTEGGNTSRTNLVLNYDKNINDHESLSATSYYSHYDFLLYSNFTFFLEDPINGDQIRQRESRDLLGFNAEYKYETQLANHDFQIVGGMGLRNDRTNASELSRTANRRETLEQIQLGDINETNASLYTGASWFINKFLIEGGLRLERFKFTYKDALTTPFDTQSQTKTALLPKLSFSYEYSNKLQFYLKNGVGFHSNDSRVVLQESTDDILPLSYGSDLGTIWKAGDQLIFNAALWYLYLEQEFVYVGDAGIVEPSGATQRYGFDLGAKFQLTTHLFLNANLNYAHARSIDAAEGADYIPLAPEFTSTGGLSLKNYNGFNASLNYRYIADRPANEDYSITAEGYTVMDLNVNYDLTSKLRLGVAVQNLFDVEWNETQFATNSRLAGETNPVEEIHFTPGTPFFARAIIQYRF